MNDQMIRVISSPSSSTIGFCTLILFMCWLPSFGSGTAQTTPIINQTPIRARRGRAAIACDRASARDAEHRPGDPRRVDDVLLVCTLTGRMALAALERN